jgi:hypothetical protein
VEQAPEAVPSAADAANWERIRQLWRAQQLHARERMEYAIELNPNGKVRGKYGNLTRYSYEPIILNLRRDLPNMSAEAAGALATMNERFLSLRRARAATAGSALRSHFPK